MVDPQFSTMSSRFLVGDQVGSIRSLRYAPKGQAGNQVETKTVYQGVAGISVQALKCQYISDELTLLAAGYSDSSILLFNLKDDDKVDILSQWKENHLKESTYIGMALSDSAVYSCTSNGALRMIVHSLDSDDNNATHRASLPTRLRDWRLSSDKKTFAYGGDEVDLSLWNTELAFQPATDIDDKPALPTSKKRKRTDSLFSGEIWRAKNVPNDALNLRQPVRINSLTYLSTPFHLLTGTELGDVRRYDTRAGRRPASNWKGLSKIGGVRVVEQGFSEHEIFVSDFGYNLFSVDSRNGRILYSYKGFSGSVTSISPSPTFMVSTALDCYARVHSVYPPPAEEGQRQDHRGEVVEKIYLKTVPTAVTWDQDKREQSVQPHEDDDAVWDEMGYIEE